MDAEKSAGRLRDFSAQLAERLKSAPNLPQEPTRLAIRIGGDAFLLEMALAAEILSVGEITPVPWTRSWYRGLTNVRGRLVGVIDLFDFAGRGRMPVDAGAQLLVFNESLKINAAVLITRAFGIRNLKELEPMGDAPVDGNLPWERERYRDLNGMLYTTLDLGVLAATEAFSSIGV